MDLTGSTLSSPFRVAAGGGTLAVVRTAEDIAIEALVDVIETRPGGRKEGGLSILSNRGLREPSRGGVEGLRRGGAVAENRRAACLSSKGAGA